MNRFVAMCIAVVFLFAHGVQATADVTVRNAATGTIEVKVDNGSKTRIKPGEKAVFNINKSEVVVRAYSGSHEKASSTVRNNKRVKVTSSFGTWSIVDD